jgi:NAD-dependent deacetylase
LTVAQDPRHGFESLSARAVTAEASTAIARAAALIGAARRLTAFTGAGILVASGLPPFRGPSGP